MSARNIVSCKVNVLTTLDDNTPINLREGDLWDADDPWVKRHPEWFGDVDPRKIRTSRPNVAVPQTPQIERATHAPGERRGPGRPRKDI